MRAIPACLLSSSRPSSVRSRRTTGCRHAARAPDANPELGHERGARARWSCGASSRCLERDPREGTVPGSCASPHQASPDWLLRPGSAVLFGVTFPYGDRRPRSPRGTGDPLPSAGSSIARGSVGSRRTRRGDSANLKPNACHNGFRNAFLADATIAAALRTWFTRSEFEPITASSYDR